MANKGKMIREFPINKSLFKDLVLVISVVVLYSTIAVYAIETYSVSGTLAPYGQVADWVKWPPPPAGQDFYYDMIYTGIDLSWNPANSPLELRIYDYSDSNVRERSIILYSSPQSIDHSPYFPPPNSQRIYLANLDANNEVYYEGILTIEHETDC